ncbi:MAG: hypothetical protein KDB01_22640 [Planctomycetaceae bacterium]|nr:hypothetical protein [Planctomycetaceae bacterium]
MQWLPDRYSLEARVAPIVVLLLPLALFGLVAVPWYGISLAGLGSVPTSAIGVLTFVTTCCVVLASHIGRCGRRKQNRLFESWGGPPLRRAMRHDSDRDDTMSWDRIAALLEVRIGTPRPTADDEVNDSVVADKVYADFENELKQATRDHKMFPEVARENRSFGFRRNLWAMKPWAITTGVLFILGATGWSFWGPVSDRPLFIATAVGMALMTLWWTFSVTPDWVRDAADAYVVAMREGGLRLADAERVEQRKAS